MKDYKKYYAQYYNIEWDSNLFDVHHIDRNRNNNNIRNLVLLPKGLHRELHKVYNELDRVLTSTNDLLLIVAKESLNPYGGYMVSDAISNYLYILTTCGKWGLKKSFNYGRPLDSKTHIIIELD